MTLWCSFHVDCEVLSLSYMHIPSTQNGPPPVLPHDVTQSSVCSTVGLSWSFILNRATCTVLQDLLELTPKKDVLFLIGDWNAKVGSQEIPGVTGKFGLGLQNEAGQRLIEFCQENALVIANTLFQQHKRGLYTWTSPDGQH